MENDMKMNMVFDAKNIPKCETVVDFMLFSHWRKSQKIDAEIGRKIVKNHPKIDAEVARGDVFSDFMRFGKCATLESHQIYENDALEGFFGSQHRPGNPGTPPGNPPGPPPGPPPGTGSTAGARPLLISNHPRCVTIVVPLVLFRLLPFRHLSPFYPSHLRRLR